MKYSTTLVTTVISSAFLGHCAPAVPEANAAGGLPIATQCTNISIQQDWLVGECLTGSGNTRIKSGSALSNKIKNYDGKLVWKS